MGMGRMIGIGLVSIVDTIHAHLMLYIVYTAMVHARWFTSRVDGRDLEVLDTVQCTVVTQQVKLIFPSDEGIWWL